MRRSGSLKHSPLAAASAAVDSPLQEAIAKLEYLTPVARGLYIDKGKTGVLKLPAEKLREIGLLPETWSLEVVADTASSSVVERPLTRAQGNALDWKGLMKLAEKHAVRFLHPCFCVNGDDPFHVSVWEGVPLRKSSGWRSRKPISGGSVTKAIIGKAWPHFKLLCRWGTYWRPRRGRYPLFSLTR